MSNRHQNYQNARGDERKDDKPIYSRIFIVCSKDKCEEDLRPLFEPFGEIEDIYIPKDRHTGNSKGVAYVKFEKTTSAAAAIQEMHLKMIENDTKPIKVMVATNRSDNNENPKDDQFNRLFLKVPKKATEREIKQYFSEFGDVESVHLQKDKVTDLSKGLAYVQFRSFLDAAKAFEECDRSYKPVFAAPKHELKRGRMDIHNDNYHSSKSSSRTDDYLPPREVWQRDGVSSLIKTSSRNYDTVCVTCSPAVSKNYIEQLFNIVPGMKQCQYSLDAENGLCKAGVTYEDKKAAAYAVEKLNNFTFPSGEVLVVKPDNPLSKAANNLNSIVNNFKNAVDAGSPDLVHLADAIAQASSLIKAATKGRVDSDTEMQDSNFCSVVLPPPQPMAHVGSKIAQRCFVVCKPQPPALNVLVNIFRRFGDLIDVSMFPNKTFCFVKYASVKAAEEAMNVLHGATVCGVYLKVLKAEEKQSREDDNKMNSDTDQNELTDYEMDSKRMRLDD